MYLHIRPATADELGMDDCCVTVAGDQEVVLSAPLMSQAFRNASHPAFSKLLSSCMSQVGHNYF